MASAKLGNFNPDCVEMAAFARVLSHPARICILRQLAGKGEVACMDVVGSLPLSQPSGSRHMAELRKAGLVRTREDGKHVWCSLDEAALAKFCQQMSLALHPETPCPTENLKFNIR